MDIGKEKDKKVYEPIVNPVPEPVPQPKPEPAPVKEPDKVACAHEWFDEDGYHICAHCGHGSPELGFQRVKERSQ
jgi:hypothetical protein